MRRSRGKKQDPSRLIAVIEAELGRLDSTPPVPLALFQAWAPAVGNRIADRSRPLRLRGKTLIVRVNSSAWMNELQMLSSRILERLQELLGKAIVTELRFEIGPLPQPSVGIRTDPPPEKKESSGASRPYPEKIEQALAAIDDPELRATIEETLRKALS